jgi:hypothetical protein
VPGFAYLIIVDAYRVVTEFNETIHALHGAERNMLRPFL